MMDLMASLEYICAYIDDLLIITRGTLDDHIDKIEIVLARLRDAGLKVNAAKSFFCTHEIEYLGYIYILTREGPGVVNHDGKLYVIGGRGGDGTVEIYDPNRLKLKGILNLFTCCDT